MSAPNWSEIKTRAIGLPKNGQMNPANAPKRKAFGMIFFKFLMFHVVV